MSILELRRHKLYIERQADGYTDDNGDYHKGTTFWEGPYDCDAVPTTKSTDVIYEDGETHHYTFICYMDAELAETITKGMKVRLYRESQTYDLHVINTRPYKHQLKVYVTQ